MRRTRVTGGLGAVDSKAVAMIPDSLSGIWGTDLLHHFRLDLGYYLRDSTYLTQLDDQAGTVDGTQSVEARQGVYNSSGHNDLNNQATVTFDGAGDRLEFSSNFGDLAENKLYLGAIYRLGGSMGANRGVLGGSANPYSPWLGHAGGGTGATLMALTASTYQEAAHASATIPGTQFVFEEGYRDGSNIKHLVNNADEYSEAQTNPSAESTAMVYLGEAYNQTGVTVELAEQFMIKNFDLTRRGQTIIYINNRYNRSM